MKAICLKKYKFYPSDKTVIFKEFRIYEISSETVSHVRLKHKDARTGSFGLLRRNFEKNFQVIEE